MKKRETVVTTEVGTEKERKKPQFSIGEMRFFYTGTATALRPAPGHFFIVNKLALGRPPLSCHARVLALGRIDMLHAASFSAEHLKESGSQCEAFRAWPRNLLAGGEWDGSRLLVAHLPAGAESGVVNGKGGVMPRRCLFVSRLNFGHPCWPLVLAAPTSLAFALVLIPILKELKFPMRLPFEIITILPPFQTSALAISTTSGYRER